MSEVIRSVVFEHFRGLPQNEIRLKGRSLVLLGSNGKGKSSFVDGIEFLFSGKVGRFVGTGTGSIDHDDALQHVKRLGVPQVALYLNPSNGQIVRNLRAAKAEAKHQKAALYFEQHPPVDAFILRRAKILDFICDQDADRYRKFIQLLGMARLDLLQRCFVDSERQAKEAVLREKREYQAKLAVFNDPVAKFEPQNLADILNRTSRAIEALGAPKLARWSDAEEQKELLIGKRPTANKAQIETLTRAIIAFEVPLPSAITTDVAAANALRIRLSELDASSSDAPRGALISGAISYLENHLQELSCPVCEIPFAPSISNVLDRLKSRSEALSELREASANYQAVLGRIQRYADKAAAQLAKDLEHSKLLEPEALKKLRSARAASLIWIRLLKRNGSSRTGPDLACPELILSVELTRSACLTTLEKRKAELLPPDSSELENAIALLQRGIASHSTIAAAELSIIKAQTLLERATVAREAFSKARESAIQKVFEQIAGTVLDFYKRLHDFEGAEEKSECTKLELRPTSRAAAGGLRLAIQFLGLGDSKDPRAFLSEGHLDSLGLCIFLATVRIFNAPGSMLVLDDVLTSIDKEHRRRLGELLFEKFGDYQVVLTTHDEHWYELLDSSVRAWGVREKWTFIKVEGWDVDLGPTLSELETSWSFIDANLNEANYRDLGGPFRFILEDFLARTAVKLELKVKFHIDGKYTSGDFVTAGIQDSLRTALIKVSDPNDETIIRRDIGRVFGQGNLINFLSHKNPGRLEVTLDQTKDFVQGLRDVTKRCETHKLIKGR